MALVGQIKVCGVGCGVYHSYIEAVKTECSSLFCSSSRWWLQRLAKAFTQLLLLGSLLLIHRGNGIHREVEQGWPRCLLGAAANTNDFSLAWLVLVPLCLILVDDIELCVHFCRRLGREGHHEYFLFYLRIFDLKEFLYTLIP